MAISQAENAFRFQLLELTRPYVEQMEPGSPKKTLRRFGNLDFTAIERLFFRYGNYLELIGKDTPIETPFSWEFVPQRYELPSKALIFVGHNEPTLIEEQMHILSGGSAEFADKMGYDYPPAVEYMSPEYFDL